jgi:chromosome segregation protein
MRIKELSILGYKSFATRTRLVFPAGLTAIVGPNGSGKSNVSDAVRWVLGEGRASALRARSANELIFAGSQKRARGGLAEVSLTIDNSDGWLDIDYPEVIITRRAERDGQNAYQINGAKVRLRDVLDLLGGRLGQSSYTVIGQGLVDQFLSLRPDQRRTLIDDAAGIAPVQRRRDRAMRRLARTHDNMTRAQDILDEIGPRLRRMERLSKRAARHREVQSGLRQDLETWYGFQVHRAREALAGARKSAEDLLSQRIAAATAVTSAEQALGRAQAAALSTEQVAEQRRLARDARANALAAEREAAAVARTRLEELGRRLEELSGEAEIARGQHATLGAQRDALTVEVEGLAGIHAQRQQERQTARAALAALAAREAEQAAALEQAREDMLALRTRQAGRQARLATLEEDLARRNEELTAAEQRHQEMVAAAKASAQKAEAAEAAWREADAAVRAAAAATAAADVALRESATSLAAATQEGARAQARLASLHTRAEALAALMGQVGTDEAILDRLRGASELRLVGTVAELLDIPAAWEAAVAAALQEKARGVVVRDMAAVDRVLVVLAEKATPGLCIVPLADAAPGAWRPATGEVSAATQVASPHASGLAELLLGDLALVEDLAAARKAVARSGGPRRAATRDGRLVEAGGVHSLAGEARNLLEIARERRSLPQAIAAAEEQLEVAAAEGDRLAEARRTLEGRAGDLAAERVEREGARDEATAARDAARSALARAERERTWAAESIERLETERTRLGEERTRLIGESESEEVRETQLARALSTAQEAVDPDSLAAARQEDARRTAAVAEASEDLAARSARLDAAQREWQAAVARASDLEKRAESAKAEILALAAQAERGREATPDATGPEGGNALAAEVAAVAEAELLMHAAREESREASSALEDARRRVAHLDERLSEARLGVARAEDRLERLAEQLRADADILPVSEDAPDQILRGEVGELRLPEVDALPSDLERNIARQRGELRAIGAIDQEALAAFEETAERHRFLTEQLGDLRAADRDLRELIATLEREMAERFDQTFTKVASAFERFFPQLFGGGEAELTFVKSSSNASSSSEDEEASAEESPSEAGIDILARPPGKRRQPLSLLSGGERAITAVALLFALLEVSGTPFVVLDEVDAALDEANVDRFRSCLESLVENVQVVIITHNRATVQSADTVYGVTMAEDGASRTVSLRVEAAA